MDKFKRDGFGLVLLGLLVILLELWGGERFQISDHYALAGLKLAEEVGIALFLIGSVEILLGFPDWRDYFEKRIERIIVDKAYLKKLSHEQLIVLQTDTLKAFFKIDDIDRKDSFLRFFHSRSHGNIGSPYREDVNDLINISYSVGRTDQVEVEETISYRCRKVGERIQDEVKWLETGKAQSKQLKLLDCQVEIRLPDETFLGSNFKKQYPHIKQHRIFKSTDTPNRLLYRGDGIGFVLPLKEYPEYTGVDDLHVRTHIHYTMATHMPFTWTMSHPTKSITGTVTYPKDLELVANLFGMTEQEVDQEDRPGVYQVAYNSWLLPDTGFAHQLISKPATVAVGTTPQSQPSVQVAPKSGVPGAAAQTPVPNPPGVTATEPPDS